MKRLIHRLLPSIGACLAVLLVVAPPAASQSIGDRLKAKAKERADAKADQAMDKALDKVENTVNCLAGDEACIAQAKEDGKKVKTFKTEAELEKANAEAEEPKSPRAESSRPQDGAWANFDFVPGERILFTDDFSRDRVGNFPQRLQLVEGNAQIVEAKGKRWLQATSPTVVTITLPEVLPRRFTVEFDMTMSENFPTKVLTQAYDDNPDPNPDSPVSYAFFGAFSSGLIGGGVKVQTEARVDGKIREEAVGVAAKARLQADGEYMKVYLNEARIANVPSAKFGRSNKLFIVLQGSEAAPVMAGNFVVAAGGRGMYDALMADGRVSTQGILFDTGSDRIRPESGATLRLIGDMLKDHADLKLLIEGHTDNVGAPAANLALSDKRSAAVKAYLTKTYGVDGPRLQTKGFGDTKPVSPNTTPEGKQQNRRVELVKQ